MVEILAAMQRACAAREYCASEIRKKLQRYKLSDVDTEKIIASLKAERFIDELRYAEAFVRDKSRLSGWGSAKIRWTLKFKGVDGDIIAQAVLLLSTEDMREQLRKILAGKLPVQSVVDNNDDSGETDEDQDFGEQWRVREKLKAKLVRFGLSRGFEYDMVLSVVSEVLTEYNKRTK